MRRFKVLATIEDKDFLVAKGCYFPEELVTFFIDSEPQALLIGGDEEELLKSIDARYPNAYIEWMDYD